MIALLARLTGLNTLLVKIGRVVLLFGALGVAKCSYDQSIIERHDDKITRKTQATDFEAKLEAYNGQLVRAAVELAKDWRTDRMLRKLEKLGYKGMLDASQRAAAFYAKGGPKVWALGVMQELNKGSRTHTLAMRGEG